MLKITSLLRPSPYGLPIVFDDGEWVNFVYFWCITIVYGERILHCTRHVEKNKIAALKVQITNIWMKIMRNVVASIVRTIVEMRNEELRW